MIYNKRLLASTRKQSGWFEYFWFNQAPDLWFITQLVIFGISDRLTAYSLCRKKTKIPVYPQSIIVVVVAVLCIHAYLNTLVSGLLRVWWHKSEWQAMVSAITDLWMAPGSEDNSAAIQVQTGSLHGQKYTPKSYFTHFTGTFCMQK